MKYLVIVYVTYTDETKAKASIYTYDSADEAEANYYKYMGQYVNADKVLTVNVEAKNSVGGKIAEGTWIRREVVPEEVKEV